MSAFSRHSKKRGLKFGLVAFGVYFLVAFFSHGSFSLSTKLQASFTHGFFCFGMTYLSTSLMEYFFSLPRAHQRLAKYIFAVCGAGAVSLTLMVILHMMMGTPEILKTTAVSAVMSSPYYLLYPVQLLKDLKRLEISSDFGVRRELHSYRSDVHWHREWPVKWFSCPYTLEDFLRVLRLNLTSVSHKHWDKIELVPQKHVHNLIDPEVTIGFLGDIMPMYGKEWRPTSEVFEFLRGVDYLVCNFEGLITARKSVFLAQNHNIRILHALQKILPAQKIVLSVANNHSADSGIECFDEQIRLLKNEGFKVIGRRDEASLLLDGKINIVACTEWTNQPHGYLSFLEHVDTHFDSAAAINILFPHWGHELELFPRPCEVTRAKRLLEKWDCIVGHHSHVPGAVSEVKTDMGNKLVAYSLGDSATGLPRRRYKNGILLKTSFGPDKEGNWRVGNSNWSYTTLVSAGRGVREFSLMGARQAVRKGMASKHHWPEDGFRAASLGREVSST